MRGATLFSGGGGVECLLKQRINFVHAVEYDPAIAAVYRANHGDHIQVAKVEDVDYSLWGQLDYLHASPVCKNASQAKTGGVEGDGDIQSALAVVRCLEATQPRVFTLENVWGYRNFKAFRLICQALDRGGYMWHFEHLNAADFGVPQTRRRLILRAVRDSLLPGWPTPLPWVGWYAAIEDLIPSLPDSQFADWQMQRLPEYVTDGILVSAVNADGTTEPRSGAMPSFTVQSSAAKQMPRAFLINNHFGDPAGDTVNIKSGNEPAHMVAPINPMRAFFINGDNTSRDLTLRTDSENGLTIGSQRGLSHCAWLSQGHVVKMTSRALARFQSLPDSYILPDKTSLACTIIGNMVPGLLMWNVVEPLL